MNQPPYSSIQIWLLACRPKTLAAGAAPVIVGAALAAKAGHFSLPTAMIILITALLIQIGTNLANDYFDFAKGADNEERIGPLRVTQAGLVSPGRMKGAMQMVLLAAGLLGLYLVWHGGWPILIIGILSLSFAVLYTGGPAPLGYLGLGDVFVFVFFGPVAVCGTYYLLASAFEWQVFFAGCAIGLLSTAILVVNNLRDIETDAKCGKKTLAVRFGAHVARLEYGLLLLSAMLLPVFMFLMGFSNAGALLPCLFILPAIPVLKTIFCEKDKRKLNTALAQTARLLTVYSLLFCIGCFI